MNVDTLLVFILIILLMVELFTTAYRTALLNASLARLLALREEMEMRVNRTVSLLQKPQTWEASSKLTFWITRFLGAGLLLALFAPAEWNSGSIALEAGILLVVALLVILVGVGGGFGGQPQPRELGDAPGPGSPRDGDPAHAAAGAPAADGSTPHPGAGWNGDRGRIEEHGGCRP